MFGRNRYSEFKVFDDKDRFIISFKGNRDLITGGTKFGKLTQNKLDEPMLVVGENGISITSEHNGDNAFSMYLYENWKLIQKS